MFHGKIMIVLNDGMRADIAYLNAAAAASCWCGCSGASWHVTLQQAGYPRPDDVVGGFPSRRAAFEFACDYARRADRAAGRPTPPNAEYALPYERFLREVYHD